MDIEKVKQRLDDLNHKSDELYHTCNDLYEKIKDQESFNAWVNSHRAHLDVLNRIDIATKDILNKLAKS